MRIAVLADIHGNLPALRAVLAELDAEPFDAIVVAGDQVAGPCARATLEALAARPEPVSLISGNGEREALAAADQTDPSAPAGDGGGAGATARWAARDLGDQRELREWPISVCINGVCFCHGSPRRDDEIITRATADEVIAEILGATAEPLVVGGHTHQQMIRPLRDGHTYANAGSVGLPIEGRPGAFWMTVIDGTLALRVTPYALAAARTELAATGFPNLDDFLEGSPFDPLDPDWVTALFEHGAGRGEPPGDARRPPT